jgi:hypothetical protein
MSGSAYRFGLFGVWLMTSFILIIAAYPYIVQWHFPDSDDQLRLLEVRDWLAGQSWFDVTQYRMNPPLGGPMHWSRFIDLPIAAVIAVMTPFIGASHSETAALIIVPLLTLAVVMALVAKLARRLLDHNHALIATLLVPMCVAVTHQLRPMRIDHHGWQMALGLVVMCGLLDIRIRRSGILVGLALALWLSISLEGLPFAVMTMALLGLRWSIDRGEGARLSNVTLTLAVVSPALYGATHHFSRWGLTYCDAVSPVHLAVFGLAAAGSYALVRLHPARLVTCLVGLAVLAIACGALLLTAAPTCAAGPFTKLDPLVHDFWYVRVMEGLPVWDQALGITATSFALPLLAIGAAIMMVGRSTGQARDHWAVMLFMLVGATITAMLVQRASGVANLLALPAAAVVVLRAVKWARSFDNPLLRVAATVAAAMLAVPGLIVDRVIFLTTDQQIETAVRKAVMCTDNQEISLLTSLPPSNLMAPLDTSPSILLETPHKVVASGHHRNAAAMRDVIETFIGTADQAHAILKRRNIDYLVVCPGVAETLLYQEVSPQGFWSQLNEKNIPKWLTPVIIKGADAIKVWRVNQ